MEVQVLRSKEIEMKIKMIDPPSGWKYGFPKPIPEDVENTFKWLVENGYPQHEIDSCGDYFCCRYWEVDAVDAWTLPPKPEGERT